MTRYTPTEKRMMEVLQDGLLHTRQELFACLWDDKSELSAIQARISLLRKKLRPQGLEIDCVLNRGIKYRLVRLLTRD